MKRPFKECSNSDEFRRKWNIDWMGKNTEINGRLHDELKRAEKKGDLEWSNLILK